MVHLLVDRSAAVKNQFRKEYHNENDIRIKENKNKRKLKRMQSSCMYA